MPMHEIGSKPVRLENFKSSTATVIELRLFMKKMKKNHIYLHFIPYITFSCMQLPFYMFSTSMSLEDRLRLKLNVKSNIVWL